MEESCIKYKSIEKAVKVLNCFTEKNHLGVTDICNKLNLNKSNVHDILTTFKHLDYVEQDSETGKYTLGVGILKLSRALENSFSISKISAPLLQEVSNLTNERVYLAVPNKREIVYLQAMYPTNSVNMMRLIKGERANMYCTGLGKAIMAFLPSDFLEDYLSTPLKQYTNYTITDKEKMLEELKCVRLQGYAVDNMEHEFGVKCVAVPIFDGKRRVCAAISISGPSLRFEDSKIKEMANLLKKYAMKIEERI